MEFEQTNKIKVDDYEISYLLIFSIGEQKSALSKLTSSIEADFRQIVEFKRKIGEKAVLLTVLSEIDFKGHNSEDDKKNMNAKFLGTLEFFERYL